MADPNAKAPETDSELDNDNTGQRDEGQAQDVAQDAMDAGTDLSEDSRRAARGGASDVLPDDVPDLVDRMNDMLRSGHIDNDAYIGEPLIHDDEDYTGEAESGDEED
ncbi:MAG: hypothetical protein KGJ57_03700 [Sphingomonadales bacterium]|nr:hypothetical protein [Sphingomonadales bacterium]MDE2168515.1 hypothetical protein [Sphingomonadales bacterium]